MVFDHRAIQIKRVKNRLGIKEETRVILSVNVDPSVTFFSYIALQCLYVAL